jgi:uncharacterized phosphosugar-binding protein
MPAPSRRRPSRCPRPGPGPGGWEWLEAASGILRRIRRTQGPAICRAADRMADAIAAGRWVHTFGAGHAHIPCEEIYPRSGGYVGFHPIQELALSSFLGVVGSSGVRQFCFLERVEGYGTKIMENYVLDPRDVMWVFSHSGINAVVLDVALAAKRAGATVVATTSLAHSRAARPRHSSRKRLCEVADIVIDSCVPRGDAMIELPGLRHKVGPGSTLGFIAVANTVVVETARRLLARGVTPLVNPTANLPGDDADAVIERNTAEYQRRLRNLM